MMMITCRILWIPVTLPPRCGTGGRCVLSAGNEADSGPRSVSGIRPEPASAADGAGVATGPLTGTHGCGAGGHQAGEQHDGGRAGERPAAAPAGAGWLDDGRPDAATSRHGSLP